MIIKYSIKAASIALFGNCLLFYVNEMAKDTHDWFFWVAGIAWVLFCSLQFGWRDKP